MKLSHSDKLILLAWMKTKPSFCNLIARFGQEKVLAYYLKNKSEKRLKFILFALRTRNQKSYNYKPKKRFFRNQLKYPTGVIY